jgi:AcrR family transcriptional regulator
MSDAVLNLKAPLQERSRRTVDRILNAAERLLEQRPFAQISVHDIVRAAKTSIGSFYARFPDKEALLPVLYARYDAQLEVRSARRDRALAGSPPRLEAVVRAVVEEHVRIYRSRPNLMSALVLWVRAHPERVDATTRDRRRRQHAGVFAALLRCRDGIRHPDPERAVELAFFFAISACRDRILFADSPHVSSTGLSVRAFVDEVTRMVLGYLRGPGSSRG